jgi:carbamoyl-phosphate synthase large subunit
MPKRTDIRKILIIGSGPIVIGQACEFDYSGTQACKALRSDDYDVVLVNSNPATIMTDPEVATRTYIEPLTPEFVAEVIRKERPDALLPTVGGQTGLNVSIDLSEAGILDHYGVEMIGAKPTAIKVSEDRRLFRSAVEEIGLEVPQSGFAKSLKEARVLLDQLGLPVVIRPSFTLGGTGGGIAFNTDEFVEIASRGLQLSPIHEVLIEESILGWKEFELEVMRDLNDNVVIICSIENFDPMGIHTGDSITVAPAQTLTDKEYQKLRDYSIDIIRKVGVETGGSNIQFGVHPKTGRIVVIEMNPRVSRSSALASKATGFPIAKIAAKLAVGYTLDELPNDITLKTPACFEPTLDYVVVKIPKWTFEKFPQANPVLGTQMKSVGEVMAIGRTFREALLKGIRSQETGKTLADEEIPRNRIHELLSQPTPIRIHALWKALGEGFSIDEIHRITGIDPWFLDQLKQLRDMESSIPDSTLESFDRNLLRNLKREGFSDHRLSQLVQGASEESLWEVRKNHRILPVYKCVDTCAAEFESYTPYFYSTYENENEALPSLRKKVMILGSGPNRIGQGIEFDYCCCHASFALREEGYETIMVNCNPETVSTDYDTSDRLYFEPLTFEDVMAIVEVEKPDGVIVQFGGQTPLKLAQPLYRAGVPIIGTSPDSIDLAEDRKRFGQLLRDLDILQPENGTAFSFAEAREVAQKIGYPVLVRPSYVLGGRAMAIIYDDSALEHYVRTAAEVSPQHPILIDRFLEDAFEYDIDALVDSERVVIAGIMQHIEEAGIHSGDSTCVLPPIMENREYLQTMKDATRRMGRELKVVGLMNVQFALLDGKVYVLEVNPRASRTVPFVSKATGVPLAKIASQLMIGKSLKELHLTTDLEVGSCFVKSPVFPFNKFHGVDTILGPEMKSTGEVMGAAEDFGYAYAKAMISAGVCLPKRGTIFISVNERDKGNIIGIARKFHELGFHLVATRGTAEAFRLAGIPTEQVYKVNEGRPNVVDMIISDKINLIINTPLGRESFFDEKAIRRSAMQHGTPCITTLSAATAAARAIKALQHEELKVKSLQEYHSPEELS